MRIAILGGDAIRDEIEEVTKDDRDIVYREYLRHYGRKVRCGVPGLCLLSDT